LAEPPDPAAARAPLPRVPAPRVEPALVERGRADPPPEDLIVLDVEPPAGRRGRAACEPELLDALPVEADEVPDPEAPEPPPRGVVSGGPPPDPPPPDPPLGDVGGTGTEGTLAAGVETGPAVTEGTLTSGVDDGAGTLVPPGRSTFAGMAVSVGVAASTQTIPASVKSVASVALRKTPAVVIREYPDAEQ
jgi:hypothetical protein